MMTFKKMKIGRDFSKKAQKSWKFSFSFLKRKNFFEKKKI